MADHELREAITLILVNEALEANGRNRAEAISHLLDAAGTIIISAAEHAGVNAEEKARIAAQYLLDQVVTNLGGVK